MLMSEVPLYLRELEVEKERGRVACSPPFLRHLHRALQPIRQSLEVDKTVT